MVRLLSILTLGGFALLAATSVQAAPAAGMLSLTKAQSVVEQAHWRHHRHLRYYRGWRHGHRSCGWM
jgi:hypothetical protein